MAKWVAAVSNHAGAVAGRGGLQKRMPVLCCEIFFLADGSRQLKRCEGLGTCNVNTHNLVD